LSNGTSGISQIASIAAWRLKYNSSTIDDNSRLVFASNLNPKQTALGQTIILLQGYLSTYVLISDWLSLVAHLYRIVLKVW